MFITVCNYVIIIIKDINIMSLNVVIGKSSILYTSKQNIEDHVLLNRSDLLAEAIHDKVKRTELVNQVFKDYEWDKKPDYTGRKSRIENVIGNLLEGVSGLRELAFRQTESHGRLNISKPCDYFSHRYFFSKIIPFLKSAPEQNSYHSLSIGRSKIAILASNIVQNLPEFPGFEKQAFDFFEKIGLKIVDDQKPELSEITVSEAKFYYALFGKIQAGQTLIRFKGNAAFNEKCLQLIKRLFERPAGRYLISTLCQKDNDSPIVLMPGKKNEVIVNQEKKHIEVFLSFERYAKTMIIDERGEKLLADCPFEILLGHELIHVLQCQIAQHTMKMAETEMTDELRQEYRAINAFQCDPTPHSDYTDIREELTILGISQTNLISEQMLRYEFGLPKRYGHKCS